MDNLETSKLSLWVKTSTDLLAPPADWEPDLNRARARLEVRSDDRLRRRSRTKHVLGVAALATLLLCIAVPAIPQMGAFAQEVGDSSWRRLEQLWYWVTIVRPGPILMGKFPDAVKALHIQPLLDPNTPQAVSSLAEAGALAGFLARLPNSRVLPASPRLTVQSPRSFVASIKTADFAVALRNAGAADQQVPQQWDDVQLTLRIGPTVTASWSGGIAWSRLTLTQAPVGVSVPSGFDLRALTLVGLRAAGMRNREMVEKLSRQVTTAQALLFGFLPPHYIGVRQVNLRGGSATIVEELSLAERNGGFNLDDGPPTVERLSLLWSAPDRVYVLSGVTQAPITMIDLSLSAAVASLIDLANSID